MQTRLLLRDVGKANLTREGVEPPFAREALELMRAAIFELEPRRRREHLRYLGDEDLVCARLAHDPRGLVDGNTSHPAADELDLADVDPRPDAEPLSSRRAPDRLATVERAR